MYENLRLGRLDSQLVAVEVPYSAGQPGAGTPYLRDSSSFFFQDLTPIFLILLLLPITSTRQVNLPFGLHPMGTGDGGQRRSLPIGVSPY